MRVLTEREFSSRMRDSCFELARNGCDTPVEHSGRNLAVPLVDPVEVVRVEVANRTLRVADRFHVAVVLGDDAIGLDVVDGDVVTGTMTNRTPCQACTLAGETVAETREVHDVSGLPRVVVHLGRVARKHGDAVVVGVAAQEEVLVADPETGSDWHTA